MLNKKEIYSLITILLISLLAYFNSFSNSFHYDDYDYILNNPVFKENARRVLFLSQSLSAFSNRSVVLETLHLNYLIDGFNVFGYHAVNMLFHLLNCLLVFILLRETFRIMAFARWHEQFKINVPFIGGLFFAVHPVSTQAVLYISNRSILMATFFYLLSFVFFIKSVFSLSGIKKSLFVVLSITFFILGYGSKLIIITAPFLFLLYYLFFTSQKSFFTNKSLSQKFAVIMIIGIIASPLVLLFSSKFINKQLFYEINSKLVSNLFGQVIRTMEATSELFSSGDYLLTEFKAIVFYYLRIVFFPINQNIDPDFFLSKDIMDISTLFGLLIIMSILTWGLYLYKEKRLAAFGIFWFFVTLLPTSSVIPLKDVVAEHRLYLPYVGIVVLMSSFINSLYSKARIAKTALCVVVIFPIVLFSMLTVQRNFIWKNDTSLWLDAAEKSPNSPRPFHNLGEAYQKKGDYYEAIKALNKAVAISPDYKPAHNNLGTIYGSLNKLDLAIEEFKIAAKADYRFPAAHFNLGKAYDMKGMLNDAVKEYSIALSQKSDYYKAYINLANAYFRLGSYKKAIDTYEKSLMQKPFNQAVYFEIGNIYIKTGELDKAFDNFSRAVEIDKNYHSARVALGNISLMKGEFDKAEKTFLRIIKNDPTNIIAHTNLGLIYLQHKNNPSKAVHYFKKSLEIDPNQPAAKLLKEKIKNYQLN